MIRVRLVVTGDLERAALAGSLRRYFPELVFLPPVQLHSVTSSRLPAGGAGIDVPTPVRRMASAMAAEVFDHTGVAPDAVVAVDDLELVNADQPERLAQWMRRAIEAEIDERRTIETPRAALADVLRQRASLHLMVPLLEAYFFGDPATLTSLGVAVGWTPNLSRPDLEAFEVDDADYLAWARRENSMRARAGRQPRDFAHHPKDYLQYLRTRDHGRGYIETRDGTAALRGLDWRSVCANPQGCRFARSLFADLADLAGIPNPVGDGELSEITWRRRELSGHRTLRNL